MSVRARILPAVLVAGLLGLGALAGCATGGPAGPVDVSPSAPGPSAPAEVEVSAAWLDGGDMIGVLLRGSSTCPPLAEQVEVEDGVVQVSLVDRDGACTRDAVLRGIAVPTPEGVDAAADVPIEIRGDSYTGRTTLAAAPGLTPAGGLEAAQPSAGWAGADTIALLTWGSSSCPPAIADAAVSAPGEIAVTLATPPADQICTADMAPRVTVVPIDGAEPGAAYDLVLAGGAASAAPAPIRIPVAGTP